MRNVALFERRAREAEDLAALVALPHNRRHYLALARAWRELIGAAEADSGRESSAA